MQNNETLISRLAIFLKYLNIGQAKFAQIVGVSKGFANNVGDSIRKENLDRISATYPELNIVWLLTGEGEMLKTDTMKATNTAKQSNDYRLVPMYNLDARGGFGENDAVDVPEYIVDYIPFKDAKSEDICVPIFGNSMAPTYCAGATVLLHPVRRWQEFLELGQVYMIVLQDNRRIIKELRSSQEDRKTQYLCVSHNPTFDPVELPKSMIKQVFLVKAVYSKTSM